MQSPPFLRIGSRGSPLALVQARLVQRLLAETHGVPLDAIEIRTITTSGDKLTDAPLSEVGGKGLSSLQVVIRHGLRNASILVLTVLGGVLGTLLEGVVIADTQRSWTANRITPTVASRNSGTATSDTAVTLATRS